MLNALKRLARRGTPSASLPERLRLYAIGDVHGRADLLEALLALIEQDDHARPPAETQLIFIGDLIDRGPASADVVEMAMDIAALHPSTRFVMGNHEEVFLRVLAGDASALGFFIRIGGYETLISYGITAREIDELSESELLAVIRQRVPDRHRDFIHSFEDVIVSGGYAFVHAGIRPGLPLEQQTVADLRWIREPFLDSATPLSHLIVHGHTITDRVDERAHRIGIDTGAYYSGHLTAIGMEGSARWYLST